MSITMPSSRTAAPVRLLPAPLARMGVRVRLATFTISAISSSVAGVTTIAGEPSYFAMSLLYSSREVESVKTFCWPTNFLISAARATVFVGTGHVPKSKSVSCEDGIVHRCSAFIGMAPRLSRLEGEPPRMIPISCRAALYKIPCRRILENSTERFAEYEYIVVKISFDDGTEGTGWTYTQGKGGTSVLHLINDYFAKEVTAKEVSDPVGLYNLLWAATYSYGLEGPARLAYGALDVALWA